jgi:hypothetical protein
LFEEGQANRRGGAAGQATVANGVVRGVITRVPFSLLWMENPEF